MRNQATNNKKNVFIFIQYKQAMNYFKFKYTYMHTFEVIFDETRKRLAGKRVTGTVSIFFIYKIQFKQST